LQIDDEPKAISYIKNIGYFRLSAYFYPLLQLPKSNHQYKAASNFTHALDMYRFDRKLRLLLFNEIEKIEVAIRSIIVNTASRELNDIFWITNDRYFNDFNKFTTTKNFIDSEIQKSKEEFIIHFKQNYNNPYPPAWMIAEILPLGYISHIFMNLKNSNIKKKIAQQFGLQAPAFSSWIMVLGNLRNMCCHHIRTWNKEMAIRPSDPRNTVYPWIDPQQTSSKRIYYRICMIKYLLYSVSPANTFRNKLEDLLAMYPNIDIRAMGFPTNWEQEPVWR